MMGFWTQYGLRKKVLIGGSNGSGRGSDGFG